ncbi:MAG TPA: hypothetical protein VGR54_09680 [Nitrosopumilaceae archaeon]|nr:hypothetical protein [Nitrosopumilaceae archaeon]
MLEQQTQPNNQYDNQSKSTFPADLMIIESNSKNNMVTIEDNSLTETILNALGDPQKFSILKTILEKPMIISEVLDKCKISNTSGYRKVNSLVQCGLLVKNGFIMTQDGKKIVRYKSLFENFEIDIKKNQVKVKAQFTS